MRNASYTYNEYPTKDVIPTESSAGGCLLIKKFVYNAIHFEDERWMEDFGYPLGEDLLFSNKLYIMGYRVLICYNAGIKHLDAGSGGNPSLSDKIRQELALSYVVQYRIKYSLQRNSGFEKVLCIISTCIKYSERFLFIFLKQLLKNHKIFVLDFVGGICDGMKYVHSEKYKNVPPFDAYII